MARSRMIFIDSFTEGLDELPRKKQRDMATVLLHLHKAGRFSVFEATANQRIAETMTAAVKRGLIDVDNSPGYPWSKVKLTEAGIRLAGVDGSSRKEER